ncbi:MAG TPA: hypothetical protein ENN43_06845 [bacterium]|nr:hypothetical protein [bacterium]
MIKKSALLLIFLAASAVLFAQPKDEKELTIITDRPTTLTYPSYWHTPFGINRGTPFWLRVFLGNRTYFNNPQGLAATKLLVEYGRINIGRDDWQLTVYGINSGNSEVIYNKSMHALGIFGSFGSGEGQLNRPIGVACNEYGDVYVADTGNHRVSRWFNDGKNVKFILNLGKHGSGRGEFISPSYLALDSEGRLYVSDTGNNRIQVFSKSGGFLYEISKQASITAPLGISVIDRGERFLGYREDYIYLIDGEFNRIQKLTHEGRPVARVRLDEELGKTVRLLTLDVDYYGNVYAVDNLNSMIYKLDSGLNYITSFGSFGKKSYEFENPTGIAIYKNYGQVFVSDRESAQYFWIGADARNFTATRQGNDLKFDFFITERANVTIEIETCDKSSIIVCSSVYFDTGQNIVKWEVPGAYKDSFKPGAVLKATLKVMATYSSYPHILRIVTTEIRN